MTGPLDRALAGRRVLLLDGALGTELQRRGVAVPLPLWSAGALLREPACVRTIHADYVRAGADILTTATFRTTRRTFLHARMPDRSAECVQRAVQLAREAAAGAPGRTLLVAGSMGPLEDCYRPDLVPGAETLREEHEEYAAQLAAAGVDLLLAETMGTVREAQAACAAARRTGKEVMVSLLCAPGGRLLGGEELEAAVRTLLPLSPRAIGLNCLSPGALTPLLERLCAALEGTGVAAGVYANVGVPGQESSGTRLQVEVGPEAYAACALTWRTLGAAIIGGCCGTTPEHIAQLSARLHPPQTPDQARQGEQR